MISSSKLRARMYITYVPDFGDRAYNNSVKPLGFTLSVPTSRLVAYHR